MAEAVEAAAGGVAAAELVAGAPDQAAMLEERELVRLAEAAGMGAGTAATAGAVAGSVPAMVIRGDTTQLALAVARHGRHRGTSIGLTGPPSVCPLLSPARPIHPAE